jgi:HAD superfamily hydrolase (TIGR01549 family)
MLASTAVSRFCGGAFVSNLIVQNVRVPLPTLTLVVGSVTGILSLFLEIILALTLLIDLDNTLLGNEMDTFLPAYFQGLSRCLAPYAEPGRMIKALLNATQQMIDNNQPDRTLKEIFDAHFYPSLNLAYETPQEALAHFYTHEYSHLRPLTQLRPEAVALVQTALQRGYRIAVATNPLFPATAIHQRLAWAGLPPDEIPFNHITTYENAHFAKPNPAYYAEILAYLGWPEEPILMIGDDLERDISPAVSLGISSFWIHENGTPRGDSPPVPSTSSPTASGAIGALIPWLTHTDPAGLLPSYNLPSAILATLRATPAALATQLISLSPAVWQHKPSPEDWSLTEITCHMRDTEEGVNLPRLKQILHEDNPFLSGVDTDSWVETYKYCDQDGPTALQAFIQHRLQTLSFLENLAEEDWQRPARHAIFGPTNFQEISHFIAEHDRLHIRQSHHLMTPD